MPFSLKYSAGQGHTWGILFGAMTYDLKQDELLCYCVAESELNPDCRIQSPCAPLLCYPSLCSWVDKITWHHCAYAIGRNPHMTDTAIITQYPPFSHRVMTEVSSHEVSFFSSVEFAWVLRRCLRMPGARIAERRGVGCVGYLGVSGHHSVPLNSSPKLSPEEGSRGAWTGRVGGPPYDLHICLLLSSSPNFRKRILSNLFCCECNCLFLWQSRSYRGP